MKRDLRIIFMGTPAFAVATLSKLLEHNYNVVGVITAPDKPAGRGQKLQQSEVKKFALQNGLTILQRNILRTEDFMHSLKPERPILQIGVAFRILPKAVWELPENGTLNLHASLLPQ